MTEFLEPIDRMDAARRRPRSDGLSPFASPYDAGAASRADMREQPSYLSDAQSTTPLAPLLDLRSTQGASTRPGNRMHDLSDMLPPSEPIEMRSLRNHNLADATTTSRTNSTRISSQGNTTTTLGAPPAYRSPHTTEPIARPAAAAAAAQAARPKPQRTLSERADDGRQTPEPYVPGATAAANPRVSQYGQHFADPEQGATYAAHANERPWYKKKKVWFFGLVVVGGAVGGGVGGSLAKNKSNANADNYTDGNSNTVGSALPVPTSYSSSGGRMTSSSTQQASVATSSTARASSATSSAGAVPSLLPWGTGGYTLTENKQLDTCGSKYDITCNNPVYDKWYVSQSGGNYSVVNGGNTSVWNVNGQQGSSSLAFNLAESDQTNPDGCLFSTQTSYSLNVGANSLSGTRTLALMYNLDIQCIETSGTYVSQGDACQCQWAINASPIS